MLNGRYTILRSLHVSAMSLVYLARDTKKECLVVVKTPRAIGTFHEPVWEAPSIPYIPGNERNKALNGYIEREAFILSSLSHPRVVCMIDAGTDGWGNHYIVLEYLEGMPLHLLRQYKINRLKPAFVIELGCQLLEGLEAIHEAGLVHRDIKPANLIITDDGLKIIDFGLSFTSLADDPRAIDGRMIGTPLYMSPEQSYCLRRLDGRADLYAVGHVLYRLLAETWAYGAEKIGVRNVIDCHRQAQPIPFDIAAPGMRIPKDLERVIFRALKRRADDRFQSAGEMREALIAAQA
ncbi:MAG: serine/threonine-protein kinase [Patescibacteria group bacterium]|jgi:serine/threonine-protein kinase